MKQQINLYQPIFRKQQIIFSARTLVGLGLGFAALLLLWSLLIAQRVGVLEAEHQRQLTAEQRAVTQLTELRRTSPPSEPSADLERQREALTQRRSELRASLTALERRQPAAEARLREQFDALSRQVPRGLWLTELHLGGADGGLTLHGRALAARLVPEYLEALSSEPLIAGRRFGQIRVRESNDGLPGIHFVVSTRTEEES